VLPTGAGKSPLMAALAREAVENWQGRVGIIAHVGKLVKQNSEKLRAVWPDAPMGIYAAGLNRRDRFDKILVMQIQSVAKIAHMLGKFDLLLIDEGHRVALKDEGRYRMFIAACKAINPALRVVILTATAYRLQGVAVPICGPDYIANEVAYEAFIPDLIADGYLSKLVNKKGGEVADLSGVRIVGGEYVESELSDAMMADGLVQRTVTSVLSLAHGRKCGIVFCVDVKHAIAVADELKSRGESVAVVYSGSAGQTEAFEGHESGKYRWLVNVNIASEGYDNPMISVVVMLRPTKSPGLMYQQIGREFRIIYAPGYDLSTRDGRLASIAAGPKPDSLVLDFAGNLLEHGPVDAIKVRSARPKKAAHVERGTSKECPKCQEVVPMQTRECPGKDANGERCTHTWGNADPAHSDRPVDAPVLSTDRERVVNEHLVHSVNYARHEKPGKTPSLRVTYQCGMRRFSEWVCIEHAGMARAKALRWWQARSSEQPPRTVEEALPLAWKLPSPLSITVDETGKYPEISTYEFAEQGEAGVDAGSGEGSGSGDPSPAHPDAVQRLRNVPGWLVQAVEATSARKRAA
jgi:DNA repair protein RadD